MLPHPQKDCPFDLITDASLAGWQQARRYGSYPLNPRENTLSSDMPTVKFWGWKKLHPLPPPDATCHLGDVTLCGTPTRLPLYSVYWPLAPGKTRACTSQDPKSPPRSHAKVPVPDSLQKGVWNASQLSDPEYHRRHHLATQLNPAGTRCWSTPLSPAGLPPVTAALCWPTTIAQVYASISFIQAQLVWHWLQCQAEPSYSVPFVPKNLVPSQAFKHYIIYYHFISLYLL